MYKIDFVLPWVDSSDPHWQQERATYNLKHNTEDKQTQTRFRDMHTLKYVLRSIEKHCPWYHKIYLITTGHYPKWLDISHPKIELITHEELFIDKSALPTFNSSAIEMNLINIKELSENFIYLNDDMLLWKPLEINRFFINKKPVDFLSHGWIPRNNIFEILKKRDTWIYSLNNNLFLVNKLLFPYKIENKYLFHKSYPLRVKISNFLLKFFYKKIFWIEHWHHPQPYLKKTFNEIHKAFEQELIICSKNKFRSNNDLTQYLYRYWHLLKKEFEPYYHNDSLIVRPSSLTNLKQSILKIEKNNTINFICFNDQAANISDKEFNKLSHDLSEYLEKKFPVKASFEI